MPAGVYVPAEEVVERDGKFFYEGAEVNREYGKMGKSLKNAVAPDEICAEFGADTLRVYEMSMGPLDTSRPWATKDVVGAARFLQRVWRVVIDEETGKPVSPTKLLVKRLCVRQQGDFRCHRGLHGAARQHGRREADRVQQPPHPRPSRWRSALRRRTAGADARSPGSAPLGGTVSRLGSIRNLLRTAPSSRCRGEVARRRHRRVPDPGQRQGS